MLRATPSAEDTVTSAKTRRSSAMDGDAVDLYQAGEDQGIDGARRDEDGGDPSAEFHEKPSDQDFLRMVAEAEDQAQLYINQVNRKSWSRVYRAYHQEHFVGSKYTTDDYRNRSKIFVPKTRSAVRKDLAAVSASLFGTLDAVACMPGNEGDQQQRASAAIVQELINYRTDRSSRKTSIPWYQVAIGARQTSLLAGICLSKQSWRLDLRRDTPETVEDEETGEELQRDVWRPDIDRPDCQLIPPENFVIDPSADWTCPAQDAAYVIIKWPMRIDEIRRKQYDPRQPWKELTESQLRGASGESKFDMEAIRRAREQGLDRFDDKSTTREFDVVWVYETYMRTAGEDWTFLSVGDRHMLTDPKPVREVYPEQGGERPLVLGYGAFEAFRIFPMSPAESWQMLQMEVNDLRNLTLDAIKQSVLPVAKVVRGRQVDLDTLKRRGQGSSIMVTDPNDVVWDRPPDIPGSAITMKQHLDIDFDDAAGQQNWGTVDSNNSLGRTLGGLKLAAGAANAVQEFDIRIWIETWCEPVLAQIAKLEQYYESDPIVLGLCGERAKLLQRFGVNEITNDLLENQVTIRVNIGLGSGDPSQRLSKFQSAINIALPLLQQSPEFQSGKRQMDFEAIMDEVFGASGYRDGGKRFVKDGEAKSNPMQQPQIDKLVSETEKNRALAKKAIMDALSNAAKVGIDVEALKLAAAKQKFDQDLSDIDQFGRAVDMGNRHGHAHRQAALPSPDMVSPGPSNPVEDVMAGAGAGAAPPRTETPGEGIIAGADNVGAGNSGLSPEDISREGVPAGDAGQQRMEDMRNAQENLEKATKPKGRRLVHHRGPDGRITHSDVFDL